MKKQNKLKEEEFKRKLGELKEEICEIQSQSPHKELWEVVLHLVESVRAKMVEMILDGHS